MGKRIVAFGEVVWDILPEGKILGGTPSNMVFRCNSFGDKGFLLSRLGDDELGHEALKRLKELKIGVENIQVDAEFPTGTVKIIFERKGDPEFDVALDVAFDHIEFSAEALELARNADCLFFGLLAQRYGISKNTIRELIKESPGSLKFFDLKLVEHYFDRKIVESLLQQSDIVRIKQKEIPFISEHLGVDNRHIAGFSQKLSQKYSIELVLVTRGQNGVFAWHRDKGSFYDAGYKIKMVDNIGSGIAFSAGFIHYYLKGKPIQEALNFGNAAGALNATKQGATVYFNKSDVIHFIRNTPHKAH